MASHKFVESVQPQHTVVLGVGAIAQLVKREKKLYHSGTYDKGPERYDMFHLLIMKNGAVVRLTYDTAIKDLCAFINQKTMPPLFKLDNWYFERRDGGLRIFNTGSSPFIHGTLIDLTEGEAKALAEPMLTWNYLVGTTNEESWA